jgi:uncharacterized protein YcbK (DUF882 family)
MFQWRSTNETSAGEPPAAGLERENYRMTQEQLTTAESRARLTRRRFLGLGAVATAAAVVPSRALATTSPARGRERVLSLFNTHTGERLRTTYCCDGHYQAEALKDINYILRDFRANEVKAIDPKLLDLLHELGGTLETDQPFHIISGYRSPHTNAMLRTRGGAQSGVASGSLHQDGKAIDIRVPGVNLDQLRAAARSLKLGGVGYYPSSNFVHVDTGRVRFW